MVKLNTDTKQKFSKKKLKAQPHDLPDDVDMQLAYLRRLVDHQQFESLHKLAKQCFAASDDARLLPLILMGCFHSNQRMTFEVLAQVEERLPELDLNARVDLAGAYCLLNRVDDARALLAPALRAEPRHALASARMAWCFLALGKLEEAQRFYERSASLEPNRFLVWSALARLYLETKHYEKAQSALDHTIARFNATRKALPDVVAEQFDFLFRTVQFEIWVASGDLERPDQWFNDYRGVLPEDDWVAVLVSYSGLLAGKDHHDLAENTLRDGLKHYAGNLAIVSQMAELAQVQGRTQQVVALLRRCIHLVEKQNKPQVVYWVRLSNACLHNMEQQARDAAEKAVELAAAMTESEETPLELISMFKLQAMNALAQVESQAQNFEMADMLFREVLHEHPWFMPALNGLGQQQMLLGRLDEAIALFERVKEIDPANGFSALVGARKFPEDEVTLVRLESSARHPGLEGSVRSGLLLQLASAWEKRKDYEKAFALAVEANDANKKRLTYDAKEYRQSCARIRYAFCRELYLHQKNCGVDSAMPIFVVGMPRSGTTLVEQIIAGHSQIFGAGELGVIPQRIQGLNRWERHVGSGRQYPDCVDDLTPYVAEGIANGILDELRELAADDKPDAKYVVDKLPHNFENIGFIKLLFPNAKIISVRRDPRDIAISNYFTDYQAKHGGMGFAYDLTHIGEQLADHNLLMQHWSEVFPGEILEVKYEDVVEDLEGSARRMLDYIGVDWEPQVLAFNELDRPVKTASVWQVRQPVYKTSKAKWLRYERHLAPLIKGTNAKIECDAIEMVRLPEPGLLNEGVEFYKQQNFDAAEYSFKKLLHHIPDHSAANFMVGLVYAVKGHLKEAIQLMEKGHEKCPWNPDWRKDLIQAYEMIGDKDKAKALKQKGARGSVAEAKNVTPLIPDLLINTQMTLNLSRVLADI